MNKRQYHRDALGPLRVQIRRDRRWQTEPKAVKVDRTTKWGNPFPVGDLGRAHALAAFRSLMDDPSARAHVGYPEPEEIRAELAGRDLACWCRPEEPCHADVLLKIANG